MVAVDSKRFNVRVWSGPMMGNQNSAGKQTPRNVTPLLPCGLFTVEEKYPYEPDDYYRRSECCLAPPPPPRTNELLHLKAMACTLVLKRAYLYHLENPKV